MLIASKGEEFEDYFDKYIKPYFIKGVPSIFTEVEEIYSDPIKIKQIETIIHGHLESLESNNTFKDDIEP
jgi:predicted thioredoxin/glutaredoxin